jgi:hypothetical protein
LLDEELTGVDEDCRLDEDAEPAAEVEEDVELLEGEGLGEAVLEVGVDVEALVFDAVLSDDEVPGIVLALTNPRSATPATAVNVAPAVSRLSIRIAASRLRTLPAASCLFSMIVSLSPSPKPNL